MTAYDDSSAITEAVHDEHKTLEAHCLGCGKNGDAVCPHCGSEYGPDSPIEEYRFKISTNAEFLKKFADFAGYVKAARNGRFWLECFTVASGDASADGESMEEIAKRWSVTKACVSKTCIAVCARLGIPPSRAMRDEASRDLYKQHNRRNKKP